MMEMVVDFAGYVVVALLSIFAFAVISAYAKSRLLSDKLLALASKEFQEKSISIMETPSDLPDVVLDHIAFLNSQAFAKGTPKTFYRLLKSYNQGAFDTAQPKAKSLTEAADKLRPELRELLGELTVMWFNLIINRNLFWGTLIAFELKKLRASKGDLTHSAASVGSTIFPTLEMGFGRQVC